MAGMEWQEAIAELLTTALPYPDLRPRAPYLCAAAPVIAGTPRQNDGFDKAGIALGVPHGPHHVLHGKLMDAA